MPELPEVETIKNDLRAFVVGRRIRQARVLDARLARGGSAAQLEAGLSGSRVEAVDRRAKYLLFRLSTGMVLVVHLAITGQLLLVGAEEPASKSTLMVLDLDDGRQLRLVDSSHLARVYLLQEEGLGRWPPLAKLGPEVLSDELTFEAFARIVGTRGRQIKPLLLDQRVISGLGNIYVDEALFAARIHPLRRANSLSTEELQRLYNAIRSILAEAIALRGTTTRAYRDLLGRKGGYQEKLRVVGRAGEPCVGCGGTVTRMVVAGRETYICPTCQRLETIERPAARAAS